MKKKIVSVLFVICVVLLCACRKEEQFTNQDSNQNKVSEEIEGKEENVEVILDEVLASESESSMQESKESEYDEFITDLIDKANDGDSSAMNSLAYYFFNGFYVEQDYEKSLEWSLKGAEGGNLACMFNVGYNYYYGYAGEVDYTESFYWYNKAAEKMYPKALNALGHLYYEGLGVEKDVEKAVKYTLQSAGFLHNYSFSNMGTIIDDGDMEGNSNLWYRLAAKNFWMTSSTSEILYENVKNGEISIDVKNDMKSTSIPTELVDDIFYRFYAGTLNTYLTSSNEEYLDFDIEMLEVKGDSFYMPSRWFDILYYIDIDDDGIEELISFHLDGTIGVSSYQAYGEEEGTYVLDENSVNMDLDHGPSGIVTYDGEKYFVIAELDIGDQSIFGVTIFAFDGYGLGESVSIDRNISDVNQIKTYQYSEEYDELNILIEEKIENMFVEKYNSIYYEDVNESVVLDFDMNNDGIEEHLEYSAFYWGTINHPIVLEFNSVENREEDIELVNQMLYFNDLSVPLGIETYTVDGLNYVSVLAYETGTDNFCFTTFKMEDNEVMLLLNHLIYFDEQYVISENNNFYQNE
jgi:hypothetical protein